jgi:ABC-type glycerol-3-phosphate transport system permease component
MVNADPDLPLELKVVAGLFIFQGVCAAIEIVVSLAHGHLNLNFGVLAIPAGFGLLRLSRGWRTFCLVLLWFALLLIPVVVVLVVGSSTARELKIFGQEVGKASQGVVVIFAVVFFLISLWQYRVLTREEIRRRFGLAPKE